MHADVHVFRVVAFQSVIAELLQPRSSTLFPYTTLFRSICYLRHRTPVRRCIPRKEHPSRSEEHTSELQSHSDLVCRLLLEKKKYNSSARCDRSERHLEDVSANRSLKPDRCCNGAANSR